MQQARLRGRECYRPAVKATTLDEALIRSLAGRRLGAWRLILYTQHRARRELKIEPSQRAVKAVIAKAVKKGLVVKVNDRYELGIGEARKAKAAKTRAAKKRALRPPMPPRERCYFPAVSADAFDTAAKAIKKRFEVIDEKAGSVAFRWRHTRMHAGPEFRLMRVERDEVRRVMRASQRRKVNQHTPPFVTYLALAFKNLDEVLDEANGLIEAQHVIGKATRGPMFLSWNKTLMSANGDVVKFREEL